MNQTLSFDRGETMDNQSKGRKQSALSKMAELSDYEGDAQVSEAEILRRCREARRTVASRRRRAAASDSERTELYRLD